MGGSELNKNWDVPLVWYEGEAIIISHIVFRRDAGRGKGHHSA